MHAHANRIDTKTGPERVPEPRCHGRPLERPAPAAAGARRPRVGYAADFMTFSTVLLVWVWIGSIASFDTLTESSVILALSAIMVSKF